MSTPVTTPQFYLDHLFKYHAPNDKQLLQYEFIRSAAKDFARVVFDNTPPGDDQTFAIRSLRECVMTANASIALER